MRFLLDISNVTSLANLDRKRFMAAAQQTAEAMTFAVYNQIRKEANKSLKSTRQIYKRNINSPVMGRLSGTITLTGKLPNMLEQGASAFDMKEGFSRSQKVKKKKGGGWYLTIPFRYAGAGAIGESSAFSGGIMPPEIKSMLKDLKTSVTVPFLGTVRQGGRISVQQLAATKFGVLGSRNEIKGSGLSSAQSKKYDHKSPIFAGAVKSKAFYQRAAQTKVNTFRRVSGGGSKGNSAPNSWIHRGLDARDLFPKGLENANLGAVATRAISDYLSSEGL